MGSEQFMKTRKLLYTDKGYSYLICTKEECFKWGGMAICDSCGKLMNNEVYLIYILGQAFCPNCFKEWTKESKRYEDDLYLQKQNHERWYQAYGFKTV